MGGFRLSRPRQAAFALLGLLPTIVLLTVASPGPFALPEIAEEPEDRWLEERLGIIDWAAHEQNRLLAWAELRVASRVRSMAAVGDAIWENLGPLPVGFGFVSAGRLVALAVHPADENVIVVGADGGGIWRTENRGQTWRPMTDRLCARTVFRVLFDPANPAIAYAASNCGVLRSLDAGQNWHVVGTIAPQQQIGAPLMVRVYDIALDTLTAGSTRGTTVLAITGNDIYRSTDSGVNFSRVLSSADGSAWSSLRASPTNPARFYALLGSGLYRSDDSGRNWQRLLTLSSATVGRQVSVSPKDGNVIYLTRKSGDTVEITISRDGGSSWEAVTTVTESASAGGRPTVVPLRDGSSIFYYGLDHKNGTAAGFVNIGGIHVDGHEEVLVGESIMYVAGDGGLFEGALNASGSAVTRWTARNGNFSTKMGYPGLTIDPANDIDMLLGLQDNGSVHFRNGNWEVVGGADGGWTAFEDRDQFIVGSQRPLGTRRCRRQAGPATCMPSSAAGLDFTATSFMPPMVGTPSGSNIYYGTSQVYRLKKGTGPTEWEAISDHFVITNRQCANGGSRTFITALAVRGGDPDVIIAGAWTGQIIRSTDGGSTWAESTSTLPCYQVNDIYVDPVTGVMFAAYARPSTYGAETDPRRNQGAVFTSSDGGRTWLNITGNLPFLPALSVAYDPARRLLFAGNELGVYVSGPEGGQWQPAHDGMPIVMVQDLAFDSTRSAIYADTWGRGVYRLRLPR